MYLDTVANATIFEILHRIDADLADQVQRLGCPRCAGPLHHAFYLRKPRGGPDGLPERYAVRMSLCCGREGCRHRTLPPSCLFLGRKVYWGAVILVIVTLRQQRLGGLSARKLRALLGVSWETVKRWMSWFARHLPRSDLWRRRRGMVPPTVRDDQLPEALLELFTERRGDHQQGLVACLEFLATGRITTADGHAR